MLYHLLYPLHSVVPGFNVFRYLTFRTAYAILTGLLISLILGPWVIRRLRRHQIGETIREDGPKSHQNKAGTPTMGGLLILMALSIPTVLWSDLTNRYVWLLLSATFAFGAIGVVDDWLKLARVRRQGMRIGEKLLAQTLVAGGLASFMYFYPEDPSVATQITFTARHTARATLASGTRGTARRPTPPSSREQGGSPGPDAAPACDRSSCRRSPRSGSVRG
jgi:phospho-N-acetylmuramoyl-pentapeptide-transferase